MVLLPVEELRADVPGLNIYLAKNVLINEALSLSASGHTVTPEPYGTLSHGIIWFGNNSKSFFSPCSGLEEQE